MSFAGIVFVLAPLLLGGLLLWRYPQYRHVRWRHIAFYVVFLSIVLYGALRVVAEIATAHVPPWEVVVVLWFTLAWRLAWTLWTCTVGRLGQKWVRWARLARRRGTPVPGAVRLIRPARALVTATVFFPAFLAMVVTHRAKLTDAQDPQSVFAINYESVRVPTSDGLMLDAWFVPQPGAERTILVCHGAGANKGNFVWFLGPLAWHGYNVMFFDFRAHGASDGRLTTYGIRERLDVLAAVAWLKRERRGQAKCIVGLGSSQGAMALALAAAEEPRIDAIVLDSPFTSPRELVHAGADRLPILGPLAADWMLLLVSLESGTNFFTASAEQAIASMRPRPVFVVHGEGDIMMPAAHAERLYRAAPDPREIWFGPGTHSNVITTAPDEYARRLFAFLDRTLGPAPHAGARKADDPLTTTRAP